MDQSEPAEVIGNQQPQIRNKKKKILILIVNVIAGVALGLAVCHALTDFRPVTNNYQIYPETSQGYYPTPTPAPAEAPATRISVNTPISVTPVSTPSQKR